MKKLAIMFLVLALAAGLCACGGSGGASDKAVDLSSAAEDILGSGAFSDILSQPPEGVAARLYGYDEGDVEEYVLYTGTGATAEEIFLVKAADGAAASRIAALCRTRVDNQKTAFESYVPAEIPKLDSAVVTVDGNYVFFVVANDAAAASAAVSGVSAG